MTNLDELDRRLGEIQDELMALGDNEFARKNELHIERDRLRAEAAQFRRDTDLDRPSSDLIAELKQHRKQLDTIDKTYINTAEQFDAGFGLAGEHSGPGDTQWINQNIDEGTDRAKIEARIAHLETVLKDRGHL
jgi:hypothetical protein